MNEELYTSFENYFNNEMSQEEKLELELQLQNDADIKQKFEIYKEINGYLETKFSSETVDFKKNLESISNENFTSEEKETKVIIFKPWYYAVAASVTILLGTWFVMQNQNPTYNDYNQHENAMFTERGEAIKNLKKAEKAFNEKNYKEAVVNFELVLKEYNRPEINYFYAISLIETNDYTRAETVLNVLKSGKSVYKEKAIWQLALSNLKQKKHDECKTYLKQISVDAEDYDNAQKLLKKLD